MGHCPVDTPQSMHRVLLIINLYFVIQILSIMTEIQDIPNFIRKDVCMIFATFCLVILIFAFSLATSLCRLLCDRTCSFLYRECNLLLLLWQPRSNLLQGAPSSLSQAHHLWVLLTCVPNYHPQSSCIRARASHLQSDSESRSSL